MQRENALGRQALTLLGLLAMATAAGGAVGASLHAAAGAA